MELPTRSELINARQFSDCCHTLITIIVCGMCIYLCPQSVGSVYSGLMQGVGAAEKVFEFIDRQPTMVHDGDLAPDHLEGRVDFEDVTFTYRTRPHTQVLQVR